MKSITCALVLGLALLAGGVAPAQAAVTLEQISAQVASPVVLRGQFEQSKTMTGFRNPLRSQGQFVVARDKGVIWKTEKPFASELVVTAEQIRSRQADGSQRVEVDATQQPAMRSVNEVMFALISGDMKSLTRVFKVEPLQADGNGWKLRLTPRSRMLARAFSELQLQGDRHVRQVEIIEASGDQTSLRFKSLSESPASLRADETSRFD